LNYISLLSKNNIVLCSGQYKQGKSVFLFPGHGAQYVNMLRELAQAYPVVQQTFDRADCIYQKLEGKKLTDCFISNEVADEETVKEILRRPCVMQPAIFCCNMAMFYLLKSEGFHADCYVGHSLGELSALCAANVFDFEIGLQIAYHRGRCAGLIREEDRGFMLAVNADCTTELEQELLVDMDDCHVSIVNSAKHFNISGSKAHIETIQRRCEEIGIHAMILNVTHAFHSDFMLPAVAPYREVISNFHYQRPEIPVYSTILERFYMPEDFDSNKITEILASQLVKPFNFRDIIRQMDWEHYTAFIEVGPSNMLGKLVHETIGETCVLETNNQKKDDIEVYELYKAAYQLNQISRNTTHSGASVDWKAVQEQISRITMYPQCVIERSDEPLYTALAVTDEKFDEIRMALKKMISLPNITKETSLNDIYYAVSNNENIVLSDLKEYLSSKYHLAGEQLCGDLSLNEICEMINKRKVSVETLATTEKTEALSGQGRIKADETALTSPDACCKDAEEVKACIRGFIQEKTGYPAEFLEDDLDFEADLGIDSVKQSEIFSNIMEEFGIQVQENLKEYNTVSKVAAYIMTCCTKTAKATLQHTAAAKQTAQEQTTIASEARMNPHCNVNTADIHDIIVSVISEKTGYPKEILEDELELEADLGIDSVKQADIFAKVSEDCGCAIGVSENIKDYNTIAKMTAFLTKLSQAGSACAESGSKPDPVLCLMPEDARTNRRCVTVTVPAEFDVKNGKAYDFQGKTVLLIADTFGGDITGALCQKLRAQGANPIVISEQPNTDTMCYAVRYTDAQDVMTVAHSAKPFDLEHYYRRAENSIYFGDSFRYVRSAGATDDQNYAGTVQIPADSVYFSGSAYSRTVISPR